MVIRTKILATVGPASGDVETLRRLVGAGCDAFRINFSHGDEDQRERFLRNVRQVEVESGRPLAVVGDLCGPKIRIGPITGGAVLLAEGQEIAIERQNDEEGDARRIGTTLAELVDVADVGERILLDDGKLVLEVVSVERPERILCRVVVGGVLSSGKGVNLPQTKLTLLALTEKDHSDVAWIAARDFDYVALSFVQRASDVEALRRILADAGSDARIIAKIEKPQALDCIEEILDVADAVMVARGDLGVEMNLPAVPVAQKRIAQLCHRAGKLCIIATQMLESMTHAPLPTRAEVSDVANAVLDQADAVMLSGETAVGEYPARAAGMMNDIVAHIQAYHDEHIPPTRVAYKPAPTVSALAAAVREIVASVEIRAVAVFTLTGATARVLSKNRLTCPILALSPDIAIVRRMGLYYGVEAVQAGGAEHTRDVLATASKFAVEQGIAERGDRLVVVSGRPIGQPGRTNTLVVHTIE